MAAKSYETPLSVDGKIPEDDIRKIVYMRSKEIKKHRDNVKNVYEGHFKLDGIAVEKAE